jgi:cell division protein FtsW (lipid II flippase)
MERELSEMPGDSAALGFAAGCLRAALTMVISARVRSFLDAARGLLLALLPSTWSFPTMNRMSARPRLLGLICGAGAVVLGLAYMLAAGAPSSYLLVNLAALVIGATAWLAFARTAGPHPAWAGAAVLALAAPILLTALFGVAADGASRWMSVGPLNLQVSLIVLPVMLVLYATRPDGIGTASMMVAALALAAQPDRAMAGVLLAGLLALLVAAPSRLVIMAATAAMLAFGWTLLKPDMLPASPYVDHILYTAFDVHPLAGLAVVIGAVALVMPAAIGASALREASQRSALLAFGGCWFGVVVAAALDNYPTPLVGYGGSAVLGYLLSVALLPNGLHITTRTNASELRPVAGRRADQSMSELRIAGLI